MKSLNLSIKYFLAAFSLFLWFFFELNLPFEKKDLSAAPLSGESLDNNERIYAKWLKESDISDGWKLELEKIKTLQCSRVFHTPENINFCQRNGDKNIYQINLNFENENQLDSIDIESFPLSDWREYNNNYHEKYGISLEEKILFKASHVFELPVYKLLIEIRDACSSILLRINSRYEANRSFGSRCLMNDSRTLLTRQELRNRRNINLESNLNINSINEDAVAFFQKKYPEKLKWRRKELGYLSFQLDELRGEVIANEKKWERLQFSLVFQEGNEGLFLILHSDGQFTSGLNAPKASSYYDMEPRYSENLRFYSDSLLFELKSYLVAN